MVVHSYTRLGYCPLPGMSTVSLLQLRVKATRKHRSSVVRVNTALARTMTSKVGTTHYPLTPAHKYHKPLVTTLQIGSQVCYRTGIYLRFLSGPFPVIDIDLGNRAIFSKSHCFIRCFRTCPGSSISGHHTSYLTLLYYHVGLTLTCGAN
jgi:hypothetical protein